MQPETIRLIVAISALGVVLFFLGFFAKWNAGATLAVAGTLMGAFFVWLGHYDSVPGESTLTLVRGRIVSSNASAPGPGGLTFRLDTFPHDLGYSDWMPRFSELPSVLQSGEEITVWVSSYKPVGTVYWSIYRIDQGQRTIVSYRELADAMAKNRMYAFVLAALGVVTAIVGLWHMRSTGKKPGAETQSDQPAPTTE